MSSKYIIEKIHQVIEYIENNIQEYITADNISDNMYLSKYHLQRLFKAMTGSGLIEYVRSRKLTESLYDLAETDMTVSEISQKYGFDYEQSYARAFKSKFNVSPVNYRVSPKAVNITPKANVSVLTELESALIIKPFHIYRPSFVIGGILNKVGIDENEKDYKATNVAVDFFYNKRPFINNAVNPNIYYGYTIRDEVYNDFTYYLSGIEIASEKELPDGFTHLVVPAHNYSVFRFIGFFAPEQITWKHMVDIWNFKDDYLLEPKELDFRKVNHFEYIDMSICREDYCELDLYVPVV